MLKNLWKKITLVGLAFFCWAGIAQADATNACGKDGKEFCDLSFVSEPAFANVCVGLTTSRTFIIQNNSPVPLTFDYIKLVNANGSNNPDAQIDTGPLTTCGTSIAPGTQCNIVVDITPTVPEVFNLLLKVKVKDSTAKEIVSSIQFATTDGCNVAFSVIPSFVSPTCTNGPTVPKTFTIQNNGTDTAILGTIGIQQFDGLNTSITSIVPSSSCLNLPLNALNPSATCDVIVDVTPGATVGLINRELQIPVDGIVLRQPITFNIATCTDLPFTLTGPGPNPMLCGTDQKVTYTLTNNDTTTSHTYTSLTLPAPANGMATVFSNDCPTVPLMAPGDFCTIVLDLTSPACNSTLPVSTTLTVNTNSNNPTTPVSASVSTPPVTLLPIPLGDAGLCAVLAHETVTNTGPTAIVGNPSTNDGNVCLSPGTSIVGFPPGIITNGTQHAADAFAAAAQTALTVAYNAAAAEPCGTDLTTVNSGDLGGQILSGGVYCFSTSAALNGNLHLTGDANSVYIFKIGTTLITGTGAQVVLDNPAIKAGNIIWQVGSSATLGTNTTFIGNILALTSITMNTNARLATGRALARNGAVTLDSNPITVPAP